MAATGRWRSAGIELLRTLAAICLVFLLFEGCIRAVYSVRSAMLDRVTLPYVLGHKYGPLPPWVDGIRILDDDPHLLWVGRPNVEQTYVDVFAPVEREAERTRLLRQFVPREPESIAGNPTWTIALNSEGFRNAELPRSKPPGTFRIVCLGDSWTFGVGVDEPETFPRRLEQILRERAPGRPVEVLNLGVMGYTSLQGLRLLRSRVPALEPDLVVIGFAMNDSSVPGYRDRDVAPPEGEPPLSSRALDLLGSIEVYKLLRYAVAYARHAPEPLADRLASSQKRIESETGPTNYDELEAWTRVSPADYEKNVREMIALADRAGSDALLLYNEFLTESPYLDALRRTAEDTGAALIDTSALLDAERRRIEANRTSALRLAPAHTEQGASGSAVTVTLRALSPDGPLRIVSPHPALGAGEPNRIFMRDDGVAPDERAGDGVWSHSVELEAGTRLVYVYTRGGSPGQWEGLDLPATRRLIVPDEPGVARRVLPVEVFGSIDLKSDSWHTDATGNRLIAEALAREVEALEGFPGGASSR